MLAKQRGITVLYIRWIRKSESSTNLKMMDTRRVSFLRESANFAAQSFLEKRWGCKVRKRFWICLWPQCSLQIPSKTGGYIHFFKNCSKRCGTESKNTYAILHYVIAFSNVWRKLDTAESRQMCVERSLNVRQTFAARRQVFKFLAIFCINAAKIPCLARNASVAKCVWR